MDKFKMIVFGMIALVATVGLIGIVTLIALDRPVTAFVSVFVPLVGTLGVLGGLGYNQVKQGETLTTVAKNVNGNTTRLLEAVEKLIAERSAATDRRPDDEILPEPISADTIAKIRDDASKLPSHADSGPAHRA